MRCVSEFQDQKYGRNMRVFNNAANVSREMETLRCTVCKTEITRAATSEIDNV